MDLKREKNGFHVLYRDFPYSVVERRKKRNRKKKSLLFDLSCFLIFVVLFRLSFSFSLKLICFTVFDPVFPELTSTFDRIDDLDDFNT